MRSAIKNFLGHGDQNEQQASTTPIVGTTATTSATTTVTTANAPVNVTHDVNKGQSVVRPEVINETIKPVEIREVQPVVEVHREQKEIHQVVQPLATRQELPVQVHERIQPVQTFEKTAVIPEASRKELETGLNIQGQKSVQNVTTTTVNKAPIVHEHIHKQIIEEIQPVIYKETIEPHLIKVTVPIQEKVVEAPTVIKEVRPVAFTAAPLTALPGQQTKF